MGVCKGCRQVHKQGGHVRRIVEILLFGKAFGALGVAQYFTLRDAHPRLMRFKVFFVSELNRVGGDNGKTEFSRQVHGGTDVALVINPARSLQLHIKTVGKKLIKLYCKRSRTGWVAC